MYTKYNINIQQFSKNVLHLKLLEFSFKWYF